MRSYLKVTLTYIDLGSAHEIRSLQMAAHAKVKQTRALQQSKILNQNLMEVAENSDNLLFLTTLFLVYQAMYVFVSVHSSCHSVSNKSIWNCIWFKIDTKPKIKFRNYLTTFRWFNKQVKNCRIKIWTM